MTSKTGTGNFFEDFRVGRAFMHATPRTLTEGDVALNVALYGSRLAVNSSSLFASRIGLPDAPIDDVFVFNVVFGKTVPDISLNAIANLGYAEGTFGVPVYPGDTISATSTVIGLKENSNRKTGIVYVRTAGTNQNGEPVLDYVRWVMVRKKDEAAAAPAETVPALKDAVAPQDIRVPDGLDLAGYDCALAGSDARWDDYEKGERIDHVDGMTIEEAEHTMATRLYQNTARVHFNLHAENDGRFGRRIVYGGHVIALARAISFNGLQNAFRVAAINGGRHVNPTFAGDTIYAWTEVLDKAPCPGRADVGLLRLRTVATKDKACADFPGGTDPATVLEFDYWALLPR